MSKPVFFSDLDKPVSDLFADNFYGNLHKFVFKTSTDDGTRLEVKGDRNPAGAIKSEFLLGRVFERDGVEYDLSSKVGLDGKLTFTSSVNSIVEGLKTEITGTTNANGTKLSDQTSSAMLKYRNDKLALIAKFNAERIGKVALVSSATTNYENLTFGAEVSVDSVKVSSDSGAKSKNTFGYNFGAAYNGGDHLLAFRTFENLNRFTLGFWHKLSNSATMGSTFTHSTTDDSNANAIAFVYQKKISKDAFWKSKLDSKGILGFSYTNQLSHRTKFSVSTDVNIANLSKSSNLGVQFTFN